MIITTSIRRLVNHGVDFAGVVVAVPIGERTVLRKSEDIKMKHLSAIAWVVVMKIAFDLLEGQRT